jgi:hypothetical protein
MRALSLCQTCKRHIRVGERACPFCGAAHRPLPEPQGLKPRGRPGGRAALFLAGAAAAPGCVDEPDVDEQVVPVYGAPVDPDASRTSDAGAASDAGRDARGEMAVPVYGVAVYGVPIDRDGGKDANACGASQEPMAVPVYGIALDAGARDAGSNASNCGIEAGVEDSEPMWVPPYGLPVDPVEDAAPRDAGERDAATRDAELMVTPVYGLWLESDPQD